MSRGPLRPIWTIMVAANLDQSRVLVTTFHQNRSTMKGRSAGQRHTDTQTDRQAGWFSRSDCAPISERQQFRMSPVRNARRASIAARRFGSSTAAARWCCIRFQRAHTVRSAGGCRNGKFQNVSRPSVLCESSRNFFTIHMHETQTQKWVTRILKFEFCDF